MRKNVFKIITRLVRGLIVLSVFLGNLVIASADDSTVISGLSVSQNKATGKINAQMKITNLSDEQKITILVHEKGKDYTIPDNLYYVDQLVPVLDDDGIFSFSFYIKGDADTSEYLIRIGGSNIQNVYEYQFSFNVLFGDVNGDNAINDIDIVVLKRFLAGWDVFEKINYYNANIDGKGLLDDLDITYIKRYLAGWEGYQLG